MTDSNTENKSLEILKALEVLDSEGLTLDISQLTVNYNEELIAAIDSLRRDIERPSSDSAVLQAELNRIRRTVILLFQIIDTTFRFNR